tara:strand:+ start:828 stop:1019 length:192 start_codon:yes stop_codon:yes gene_type:complete
VRYVDYKQIVLLVNGVEVKRWPIGTTVATARANYTRGSAYYEDRYGEGERDLAIATTTYEVIK